MKTTTTAKKFRAVIVDDDIPSVEILSRALQAYPEVELCGTASNLADGTRLVRETQPDLLFLDMAFPDSNGLDWYENSDLPANTRVVFYTCYQRYIHDALSMKVFDFLLKPFDPSELGVIIRRLSSEEETRNSGNRQAVHSGSNGNKPIAITSVINSKIIVNPQEIVYFRYISERKLWECVFSNMKRFILKRQTTAETILGYGSEFVRTHKRFIVNIRYVGLISGEDVRLLPPLDAIDEIKISKSYRRELMDRFYDI